MRDTSPARQANEALRASELPASATRKSGAVKRSRAARAANNIPTTSTPANSARVQGGTDSDAVIGTRIARPEVTRFGTIAALDHGVGWHGERSEIESQSVRVPTVQDQFNAAALAARLISERPTRIHKWRADPTLPDASTAANLRNRANRARKALRKAQREGYRPADPTQATRAPGVVASATLDYVRRTAERTIVTGATLATRPIALR